MLSAATIAATVASRMTAGCLYRGLTNGTASIAEVDSTRARLIRRCDPNRAVGDRILVHVEWLKHGHGLIALLAVPERPHIVSTFPLRDQIPRIGIIFVPKQPLPLQPLHLATNFYRFLEGCLEGIPLAR